MEQNGFYKFVLPVGKDLFGALSRSAPLEGGGKGRQGNHLVRVGESGVPIVRTTTQYSIPAQTFTDLHSLIAENIQHEALKNAELQGENLHFNNALIEVYERTYAKMKYHSDQSLDLAPNSWIALFSCYEQPDRVAEDLLRRLKIKNKTTEEEFEFTLENNAVVLFSLPANTAFQHKIVLEMPKGMKPSLHDNRWLGITFRQSKTFIHFENGLPCFADGTRLKMADEAESKEFYTLRTQENNGIGFEYPFLAYTLSISDTLVPREF